MLSEGMKVMLIPIVENAEYNFIISRGHCAQVLRVNQMLPNHDFSVVMVLLRCPVRFLSSCPSAQPLMGSVT